MTDEREFVALPVAISMLRVSADGSVHTYRKEGEVLVGASWSCAALIQAMTRSPAIDVAGQGAQSMGYGLCIYDERGELFIKTHPSRGLSVWTLYDSPADYPGRYILRRYESAVVLPTSDVFVSDEIEPLREIARSKGLHCIGREEQDHQSVVESWI